jgi:hypothetical protein
VKPDNVKFEIIDLDTNTIEICYIPRVDLINTLTTKEQSTATKDKEADKKYLSFIDFLSDDTLAKLYITEKTGTKMIVEPYKKAQ